MDTFKASIEWAQSRNVMLPIDYYGMRQAGARARAFSVTGLTMLDQIQHVRDSLASTMEAGGTMKEWQEGIRASGKVPALPAHRLENIFRTNLQSHYMAGRCSAIERHKKSRPYLMYSAINDSRTRPAHAKMHGTILPVGHPWWGQHLPPNGFMCRCTAIGLTEAEAKRRGISEIPPEQAPPDKGWEYSVCHDGPEEGVSRAISQRETDCASLGFSANLAPKGSALWCRNVRLKELMTGLEDRLSGWDDLETLARLAVGDKAWDKHVLAATPPAVANGLSVAHGIVLRAYTDFNLDAWPLMNRLARSLPHNEPLPDLSDIELLRAGLLIELMDEAISKLPKVAGVFSRGVGLEGLGDRRLEFVKAHTRKGRVVAWNGYTSVMAGRPFQGYARFNIEAENAVDLVAFSVQNKPELLLPRDTKLVVRGYTVGGELLRIKVEEVEHDRPIRREHHFRAER